ncbi:MAG: DMT family transporter [Alphaproteobacteria bacterium]
MYLNNHTKAVLYTIMSGSLFGVIGFFGLEIYKFGLSVEELLFWRFTLASIIFYIISYRSIKLNQFKEFIPPFLLGILIYAPSTYLWFESIKLISSGLAMVVFYSFPVYVAIFSWIINKEIVTKTSIISIFIMLVGLILIADFNNLTLDHKGLILALISAILYGIYFFISKKLCRNIDPSLSSFMVCLGNAFGFILLLVLSKGFNYNYSYNVWFYLIAIAIIGTILPIVFLFKGLKEISELEASILSVSEPVVSLLFGTFLLNERISLIQIIGIILIILSAILIQFGKKQQLQH